MRGPDLRWYARRLASMSATEVAWRTVDGARKAAWKRRQVRPGLAVAPPVGILPAPRFTATLPAPVPELVFDSNAEAVLCAADRVLRGRWPVLGVVRSDLVDPDWYFDPTTQRRAPDSNYCFSVDHRSEERTGNVKQLWELSRMHHLTVLAAAYALTGEDHYAGAVSSQLRSWWAAAPFLSGVHWTSGIELGVRLVSWVWIRRLLDNWEGVSDLFEHNELALAQIRWHQQYLAAFRSRGSSANNHVVAEAAGQLVAGLAFPWFEESEAWARRAAVLLERELRANTFPSGVNRELASDYHGFVAELGLVAAVEADRAGRPLAPATWNLLGRMLDVMAATVDARGRPPRQGDGDEGRVLVLDGAEPNASRSLLALGRAVFGAPEWWPPAAPDAFSLLLGSLAGRHVVPARPPVRPDHYPDAGLTILRTPPSEGPEIWCRGDAGPHGFLAIAAHAHADALSIEVRYGGADVLADPGTYCYHGERSWRAYFRSTAGHNTIEVAGVDQSTSGGPFLWTDQARTTPAVVTAGPGGRIVEWAASHEGYSTLEPPLRHSRRVRLRPAERVLEILDVLDTRGAHDFALRWHLGPAIGCELDKATALLSWSTPEGGVVTARLQLAEGIDWSQVRGGLDPVAGWYSPRFGEKEPAWTLVGRACADRVTQLRTVLAFDA